MGRMSPGGNVRSGRQAPVLLEYLLGATGKLYGSSVDSRFDAETVVRTATITARGRFEIELRDSGGKSHVISLPLSTAVDLGCLIYDLSQGAPYLVGGIHGARSAKK